MTLINPTAPAGTWIPTDDTFGARLALVRQRFGWNMKEAALACGIPQNSWIEWETKNRSPRDIAGVSEKISARTNVDDYWLITGKKKGPASEETGPVTGTVHPPGLEPGTHWIRDNTKRKPARPRNRADRSTGPKGRRK